MRRFRGFRGRARVKRDNLWVSAYVLGGAPVASVEFVQLHSPFTTTGGTFGMIDPTLVRVHGSIGVTSAVHKPIEGAWGLIKLPVGTAGTVPADIVQSPITRADADWLAHGYWTVPDGGAGITQIVAMGVGSSGNEVDSRAKRKMGEQDTIVLVLDWGVASLGGDATLPVYRNAAFRLLFNGARR